MIKKPPLNKDDILSRAWHAEYSEFINDPSTLIEAINESSTNYERGHIVEAMRKTNAQLMGATIIAIMTRYCMELADLHYEARASRLMDEAEQKQRNNDYIDSVQYEKEARADHYTSLQNGVIEDASKKDH